MAERMRANWTAVADATVAAGSDREVLARIGEGIARECSRQHALAPEIARVSRTAVG